MYRLTCVSKRKEASFLKGETMRENQNKEHLKLVRQAVRGNPEAYGRLISEYQEYLYKMAFLYMRNQEDALDLVGSVVLKGYQNIHRLKNPEWFKTWLTRILINLAVDEKKKTLYCVDISEVQISGENTGVSVEEKCDLEAALRKIPDKYQIPVVLKYFSGLSVKEIAYVTGNPEGTVKACLSRGRSELKKILKEDYFYAG